MNNKNSEPMPGRSAPLEPADPPVITPEDVLRKSVSTRSRRRRSSSAPSAVVTPLRATHAVAEVVVTAASVPLATDAGAAAVAAPDEGASTTPAESAPAAPQYSRHLRTREKRRARTRTVERPPIRLHIPMPVVAVGMLLVGVLCGALLMRQRHAAQEVVVSVNGSLLKQDEMNKRVQALSGPPVARKWVEEELWLQFARKQNALPTSAAVDTRYDQLSRDPEFARAQQAGGKPPEEIKRALQVQMAQTALLCRDAQADEADARAFYKQNSDPANPNARFVTPETLEAQVIVTRTQADSDRALARLKGGESFDLVARQMSVDVSRDKGGKVTIRRNRGHYAQIPGMGETLFAMEPGGLPIARKFAGYWWLINCIAKKPEHVADYKEVAEDCLLGARLKKGVPQNYARMEADFAAFQKTAHVEAFWPQALQAQVNP